LSDPAGKSQVRPLFAVATSKSPFPGTRDTNGRQNLGEALQIKQDMFRNFNRKANPGELANAGDFVISHGRIPLAASIKDALSGLL
jgi:hypothetical protein